MAVIPESDIPLVLREHGIQPTSQRLKVARALFAEMRHLSAEDVYMLANANGACVSKATVYNTLGLFTKKGVVREVIADPTRIFYDPNTSPHHHFFDVDNGKLTDIDGDHVEIKGLPPLPEGKQLEGVDVVVRLRSAAK